jgi:hypothetical protein
MTTYKRILQTIRDQISRKKRELVHDRIAYQNRPIQVTGGRWVYPGIVSGGGFKWANRESEAVTLYEYLEKLGLVDIEKESEEFLSIDDLLGDIFDPVLNSDIKPEILEREKRAELDRIDRNGVWGHIAHGRRLIIGTGGELLPGEWIETEACWGFVGDDFWGSGYDIDFMDSTVDLVTESVAPNNADLFPLSRVETVALIVDRIASQKLAA